MREGKEVCSFCGKAVWKPERCRRCGLTLCREHLPHRKHGCKGPATTSRRQIIIAAACITILIVLFAAYLHSQRAVLWRKEFRTGEAVERIVATRDGGYILVGHAKQPHGQFLIEVDHRGRKIWERIYESNANAKYVLSMGRGSSVLESSDGGYVIVGNSAMPGERVSARVLKTDSEGILQWEKTYEYGEKTYCFDVAETTGGEFLLTGVTSTADMGLDAYIVKIDGNADEVWERTYGTNRSDWGTRIMRSGEDNFIVLGRTIVPPRGYDTYLMKVDGAGNVILNATYGGDKQDFPNHMIPTDDGGYVVVGWTVSFGAQRWRPYVLRVDASLNKIWEHRIKTEPVPGGLSVKSFNAAATHDDGFLAAGEILTENGTIGHLMKLDSRGNLTWEMTYPGSHIYCVTLGVDEGYIVGGSKTTRTDEQEAYLLKVQAPRTRN